MKDKANILSLMCCMLLLTSIIWAGVKNNPHVQQEENIKFIIKNYDSAMNEHEYKYHEHPTRIIVLWQNSIETLLALGAGNKIIASGGLSTTDVLDRKYIDEYNDIPVKKRQVPNIETMMTMKPDLIVGWLYDFAGKNGIGNNRFWENRGTNIYMTSMNGADFKSKHVVEDEIKYIIDLGKIVGADDKAHHIENKIMSKLSNMPQEYVKQKVLVISSVGRQVTIYTPRTLSGDILTRLGAEVLGKEQEQIGEDEYISYEQLLVYNPDIIFIQSSSPNDVMPKNRLINNPSLKKLKAIQSGNVFNIPFYLTRCPGVRVLDTIDYFKCGLYEHRQFEEGEKND